MQIDVFASGSTGNCYRVSDGETAVLLDAGISAKRIQVACGFKLSGIGGCLITHSHGDHSKAAKALMAAGVDVYTSMGTALECKLAGHRLHTIKTMEKITVGTFDVLPFDVEHDAPEPLGFLLYSSVTKKKLLYFTDTYYLKYTFKGLTHIMAECNFDLETLYQSISKGTIPSMLGPRIIKSHMSLEHLLEILRANDISKVEQIYLLHLSNANSDEQRYKDAVQKATGAEVIVC